MKIRNKNFPSNDKYFGEVVIPTIEISKDDYDKILVQDSFDNEELSNQITEAIYNCGMFYLVRENGRKTLCKGVALQLKEGKESIIKCEIIISTPNYLECYTIYNSSIIYKGKLFDE